MSVALLLLPDFSLILLGYGLRRMMHLGDHFWIGMEKLVYFVLFPSLLFNALTRTHIDFSAAAAGVSSWLKPVASRKINIPPSRMADTRPTVRAISPASAMH